MLRPLCPTRWTVQSGAIKAILDSYEVLLQVLEEVHATGRDKYVMKAGGLKRQLEQFGTLLGLSLALWCLL